jgi:hypothetical protein
MTTQATAPEVVRLPMVCIHSEEGLEHADNLRSKVRRILTFASEHPCTDADFTSRVVVNLHWNWGADVEFACDQWFGVYAKVEVPIEGSSEWSTVLQVSCECDRIEDGMAAIYEWFHENRAEE